MPYASLLHNSSQATVGNLGMTAAGRRKTDTTRRVAVSAETSADASDASYVPTVVKKAEEVQVAMVHHTKHAAAQCQCMPDDVQAAIRAGLRSNPLFESLAPDLLLKIVDAMVIKEHTEGSMVIRQVSDYYGLQGAESIGWHGTPEVAYCAHSRESNAVQDTRCPLPYT